MSSEHFSSPSLNTDRIDLSHSADSSLQSGTVHAVAHQSSSNCSLDSSHSAYLSSASRHWPAPSASNSQVLKRAKLGDYQQSTHQGRPTREPSFTSSQIPSETPVPMNMSSDQSLVSTTHTLSNQAPLLPFNGANSHYSHPTHDLFAVGPTLHYKPTLAPAHCPPAPRYGRTSKQRPILTSRTSVQYITGLNCVQPVMASSYADATSSGALSDAPPVPSKLHSTSLPTSGDSRDDPIVLQDSPKAGAARVGALKRSFQRTPPMAYNGSRSLKISPKMMGKATRTSPRTTLNSGGRSIISVPAPFKDRYPWMSEGRAANELQQANDASSHRASKPTINKRKRSAQADLSGQSSSSLLKKKSDQNSSSV
ncbi:hypothetical protein DL96DRAFT_688829 [Flagelloscypha sp. PMI_526]|nr:hypothetical protein DL96DRAFT_688829 [Flagelloscypha sp. PMI_526]